MIKVTKKKSISYYFGNLLIVASLLLLLVIYFPLINLYLNPPKIVNNLPAEGLFLTIPKISAQAPITLNVNPWDANIYRPVLEKGIAQAAGTSKPGENGTIFLFAHSSDSPLSITQYNTVFLRLDQLRTGDEMTITDNGKDYRYRVRESKVVSPSETQYLQKNDQNQLILQTCTPIGTALRRLLVFADPI